MDMPKNDADELAEAEDARGRSATPSASGQYENYESVFEVISETATNRGCLEEDVKRRFIVELVAEYHKSHVSSESSSYKLYRSEIMLWWYYCMSFHKRLFYFLSLILRMTVETTKGFPGYHPTIAPFYRRLTKSSMSDNPSFDSNESHGPFASEEKSSAVVYVSLLGAIYDKYIQPDDPSWDRIFRKSLDSAMFKRLKVLDEAFAQDSFAYRMYLCELSLWQSWRNPSHPKNAYRLIANLHSQYRMKGLFQGSIHMSRNSFKSSTSSCRHEKGLHQSKQKAICLNGLRDLYFFCDRT